MTVWNHVIIPSAILTAPFVVTWLAIWFIVGKKQNNRQTTLFIGNAFAVLAFIGLGGLLRRNGYQDLFLPAMIAILVNIPIAVLASRKSRK